MDLIDPTMWMDVCIVPYAIEWVQVNPWRWNTYLFKRIVLDLNIKGVHQMFKKAFVMQKKQLALNR